jgi:hypothetical protein
MSFSLLVGADVPVMSQRPGASLANLNKAAQGINSRVCESDSDNA